MAPSGSLSDYDYVLPEELIAQEPVSPRDSSRLLVYDRGTRAITHSVFRNLSRYLQPGTLLVMNNAKVDPCRLLFSGGAREVFILEEVGLDMVKAMVRPGRKFQRGVVHEVESGLTVTVEEVLDDGLRMLRMSPTPRDPCWAPWLHTPFPPYIRQNEALAERYQTVFSKAPGSKAAPTAGLHFTSELLASLEAEGFNRTEVTLHVGLGTFAPVKAERLEDHVMHHEEWSLAPDAAVALSRSAHRTAIGTTSMRVMESLEPEADAAAASGHVFHPGAGSTGIFIAPGVPVRHTHSLVTNFHLPKSTLLMLVAALTGLDEMHRIYAEAIRERYRFFSFGDAMLIR
jgi:S-adenosylmethionine:tRNA ribosyltransferase-isomerase